MEQAALGLHAHPEESAAVRNGFSSTHRLGRLCSQPDPGGLYFRIQISEQRTEARPSVLKLYGVQSPVTLFGDGGWGGIFARHSECCFTDVKITGRKTGSKSGQCWATHTFRDLFVNGIRKFESSFKDVV